MIVIDTSAWISATLPGDQHFPNTQPWLAHIRSSRTRFYVPAHFPAEVSGVLSRVRTEDRLLREAVEQIESSEQFVINPISIRQGLFAAEIARSARVRGSDAIFIALANELDVPMITWDRQQRERGVIFCRTMTPVEAMEMTA